MLLLLVSEHKNIQHQDFQAHDNNAMSGSSLHDNVVTCVVHCFVNKQQHQQVFKLLLLSPCPDDDLHFQKSCDMPGARKPLLSCNNAWACYSHMPAAENASITARDALKQLACVVAAYKQD